MSRSAPDLVVVGSPSMDRLVTLEGEASAPGGAGFNTALAARSAGIDVGLVGAIPTHLPRQIGAAFGPGGVRRDGLVVRTGPICSFHIAYDADQQADYLDVELEIERTVTADDVPEAWLAARHLHVGPLGASSRAQLDFLWRLRERGFAGSVSVGSFLADLDEDREAAHALVAEAVLFFLNEAEFADLYPDELPSGTVFVVTRGRDGVTVHDEGVAVHHPAAPVEVVDPTGAGDAFCGGYLAGWLAGEDPVATAAGAARLALSDWGSTALVAAVAAEMKPRVRVDLAKVDAVSAMLAAEARAASLDFCGFPFPEEGEDRALDLLALATLHQYGFWYSDAAGWTEPMYAVANGERFKGSDYIWQAFTRAARRDESILDPGRLAAEPDLFDEICTADDGSCPVPDVGSHRALQQRYGAALLERDLTGLGPVVATANDSPRPAAALLDDLATLPGYSEDPLAKKANLLVIILSNRPEGFLDLRDPETVTPIVDYHLMRSCLRTGCVEITDPDLERRIEARAWVDEAEEEQIRRSCFEAIDLLVARSGLSQAAVDGFFFRNARRVCVEVGEPHCDVCPAEAVCAQRITLFQPVLRTTAY